MILCPGPYTTTSGPDQVNLWEDLVAVHLSFQGKWHLLPLILNQSDPTHKLKCLRVRAQDLDSYSTRVKAQSRKQLSGIDSYRVSEGIPQKRDRKIQAGNRLAHHGNCVRDVELYGAKLHTRSQGL